MNWSVFKEEGGKTSFARLSSAIVLAAWLGWVTYIVIKTNALPSGTWEISTVVGALYSLNKVTTTLTGNTNG